MNSRVSLATESRRAVVIVLRGLGPAFIGGYGNEWIRTGTLDRLCARGVTFDRHYATDTNVATASQMCFAARPNLISDLNHAGVATIRVQSSPTWASMNWVYDEPAAVDADRPWSLLPIRQTLYPILEKLPKNSSALVWIEADLFTAPWRPPNKWLNYYFIPDDEEEEPLTPWLDELPDGVVKDDDHTFERLQSTFAASVSAMDRSLCKLLAGCRSRGFGQNAMITVTSDLGFPLGEHGPVGRSCTDIQEALLHLPLIVRLPNNAMADHRFEALTQPSDLGSTISDHFSLPGQHDDSLLPLIRGDKATLRECHITHGGDSTSVRTPNRLLIKDATSSRVFEQPSDRWHAHDVAGTMPDELARLEAILTPAAK